MVQEALAKLEKEYAAGRYDRYAEVMKKKLVEALKDFCRQDGEFAQAVVQGGTFEDCMKAVAKNCGNGISDEEAYGRAAKFYFPTAAVRFHMTIDLAPHAHDEDTDSTVGAPRAGKAVVLNLADFW